MSGNVIELTGKYTDAKMYIQTVDDLTISPLTTRINERMNEMNNIDEKKNAYLKQFNRENGLSELGWDVSKNHG